MHREKFESIAIGDTYADIFGKKEETRMERAGKDALSAIAARLPDGFGDMSEAEDIELFRRAWLFLSLSGFDRAHALYFSAETAEDFAARLREHNMAVVLRFCPSFPAVHFDRFCELLSQGFQLWMKRRGSLRECVDEPEETAEEKQAQQEARAARQQAQLKRIAVARAALPDGLDLLAFFSQPAPVQAVLSKLPVQQHDPLGADDYERAAQEAGVTVAQAEFYHNRFHAYRSQLEDFTTCMNGKGGGRIVYIREDCAGNDGAESLLQSGRGLFVLAEQSDGKSEEAEQEALVQQYAALAQAEGFSCVHCYFITAPDAESFRTEPYPQLPISLRTERVILCGSSAECRAWFTRLMPNGCEKC